MPKVPQWKPNTELKTTESESEKWLLKWLCAAPHTELRSMNRLFGPNLAIFTGANEGNQADPPDMYTWNPNACDKYCVLVLNYTVS